MRQLSLWLMLYWDIFCLLFFVLSRRSYRDDIPGGGGKTGCKLIGEKRGSAGVKIVSLAQPPVNRLSLTYGSPLWKPPSIFCGQNWTEKLYGNQLPPQHPALHLHPRNCSAWPKPNHWVNPISFKILGLLFSALMLNSIFLFHFGYWYGTGTAGGGVGFSHRSFSASLKFGYIICSRTRLAVFKGIRMRWHHDVQISTRIL